MSKPVTLTDFKERIKQRFPEEKFNIIEYTTLGKPCKIHSINRINRNSHILYNRM